MIVGCSDGTVYVWQMETGKLKWVMNVDDIVLVLLYGIFTFLTSFPRLLLQLA
jgi:hypothetical protein